MPGSTIEDIRSAAEEFNSTGESFKCFILEQNEWRDRTLLEAARSGVYVWFDTERKRVVRVGMSSVNARARALKHLRDNTGEIMTVLAKQSRLKLILFTRDDNDRGSIAEFEKHLENTLAPLIPSLK